MTKASHRGHKTFYERLTQKGSHGFHGKHETRLTRGRDFTKYKGLHGLGAAARPRSPCLPDIFSFSPLPEPALHTPAHLHPPRLIPKRLSQIPQIPQIPQIFAEVYFMKGSHGFHGRHETRLTQGRDFTECKGLHGLGGPLRDPAVSPHLTYSLSLPSPYLLYSLLTHLHTSRLTKKALADYADSADSRRLIC